MEHLMVPLFDDDDTRIKLLPEDLRKELYLYARSSILKYKTKLDEYDGSLVISLPGEYKTLIHLDGHFFGDRKKIDKLIGKAMQGEETWLTIGECNQFWSSNKKGWLRLDSKENTDWIKVTTQLVQTLLSINDFYSTQKE